MLRGKREQYDYKEHFPETIFMKIKDTGHGGLAPFQPEKFVKGIERAARPVT